MQGGDSKGKSMSPKTPQSVFLAEAEAMPAESVHLKLQLSNNQPTRFDKEPNKVRKSTFQRVWEGAMVSKLMFYSSSSFTERRKSTKSSSSSSEPAKIPGGISPTPFTEMSAISSPVRSIPIKVGPAAPP